MPVWDDESCLCGMTSHACVGRRVMPVWDCESCLCEMMSVLPCALVNPYLPMLFV